MYLPYERMNKFFTNLEKLYEEVREKPAEKTFYPTFNRICEDSGVLFKPVQINTCENACDFKIDLKSNNADYCYIVTVDIEGSRVIIYKYDGFHYYDGGALTTLVNKRDMSTDMVKYVLYIKDKL